MSARRLALPRAWRNRLAATRPEGRVLGLIELISIADPVGTKMADDNDPFGDPHIPWHQHAITIPIVAALAGGGVRLLWWRPRRKADTAVF